MNRGLHIYAILLLCLSVGWLFDRAHDLNYLAQSANRVTLIEVISLYISSHICRMLRLAVLTLDERDKAISMIAAHSLTAFPSSFLPFKIGETLRLAALFYVYDGHRKAFSVWLVERFSDVLVITAFILGLYLFNMPVPSAMRMIFAVFVITSVLGLLSLVAITKVFVYLNRHLILASHTSRGLRLLRASHALRQLELDLYKSVEGRISSIFLLSILIWSFEIIAIAVFINQISVGEPNFASLFASGILTNLPGGVADGVTAYGLYQSLGLAVLTLLSLGAFWLPARAKFVNS